MNNLIVINLLKSFLLYSPFVLVLLKDIVICILEGVQSHREKVFEKYKNIMLTLDEWNSLFWADPEVISYISIEEKPRSL